ncbi:phage neck terminator protein [Novosphingobium resinovorum]|uniref:phage neck terminator protein n=1 Tax=Novosphingobium resinovorum TaxID=158500 RepID=UPI0009F48F05|nr:hypothetical protein [Novosphingobium resinovorum]
MSDTWNGHLYLPQGEVVSQKPSVSLTEEQIFTGLRAFLLNVLADDVEVFQGQDNNVPMPTRENFVVMTASARQQLSQTVHTYDPEEGEKEISRSTSMHFQLDTYGPNASDNVQVITTLFRDAYGVDFLRPFGLAPLFCDDGAQMPLVTGEKQYLQRWTMRGVLQTNLAVTLPAEFADNLITTLVEVT